MIDSSDSDLSSLHHLFYWSTLPKKKDTTCSGINTCKTCDTFGGMGGKCTEIDYFPNATIAEYGTYSYLTSGSSTAQKIMAEIYARGPVATGVNAEPLVEYEGGIVRDTKIWHMMVNHIVSITGWGTDEETGDKYWIVRNSWVGSIHSFSSIFRRHRMMHLTQTISYAYCTFVPLFLCNYTGSILGRNGLFPYFDGT